MSGPVVKKRYKAISIETDALTQHDLTLDMPFLLCALNFRAGLTEGFFTKPISEALEGVRPIAGDISEATYQSFQRRHQNGFQLSHKLKQNILPLLQDRGRDFQNVTAVMDTALVLVKHGKANPIPLILDSSLSLQELSYYLKKGLPVDINYRGYTAIHAAFLKSTTYFGEKLKLLLAHGADPNQTCNIQNFKVGTFLHVVIANEHDQDFSDSIDLVKDTFDASLLDGEKKTILITAAKVMKQSYVLQILDTFGTDAALNQQDIDGRTALHYCYAYGMMDAARALIQAGANPNIRDKKNRTPKDYLGPLFKESEIRDMLLSVEIHPDRDFKAVRNAVSDCFFNPFPVNGENVLLTLDNLARVKHQVEFDFRTKGPQSLLYQVSADSFKHNRTARFICAGRGETTHQSIMNECGFTLQGWEAQRQSLLGVSLIEGIVVLREEMKLQPDLYPADDVGDRPPPPSA